VKRLATLLVAGIVVAGLAPHSAGAAGKSQSHASMSMAPAITVLVGQGDPKMSPGSQLAFNPKYVDVSVGDSVAFKDVDQLEPHTVTFGSIATLTKMTNGFVSPVPQKSGPPIWAIDPAGVTPTMSKTYDGTGIANSGILPYGKTWTLMFTKPGTYHYICLVHGLTMAGAVTVHSVAPAGPNMWIVQAGDGQAAASDKANVTTNDSFYPRHLTVKVGDTVEWIGGFHTITFGPDAMRTALEKAFFIPIPGGSGAPKLQINPKVVFPSGGSTYNGTGFVNSGILALNTPPTSKAPPSFKLKFTKAGTYTYDCLVHPGMDGTITVTM
jgi:plastocyanin